MIGGERYWWRDEWNYVRLDPGYRAGHVLRITAGHAPAETPTAAAAPAGPHGH
jgi:hypothetical protein